MISMKECKSATSRIESSTDSLFCSDTQYEVSQHSVAVLPPSFWMSIEVSSSSRSSSYYRRYLLIVSSVQNQVDLSGI